MQATEPLGVQVLARMHWNGCGKSVTRFRNIACSIPVGWLLLRGLAMYGLAVWLYCLGCLER
jgi:hypothetical protein